MNKGVWNEEKEVKAWETAREQVEEAVKMAESFPPPTLEDMFRYTFAEMPDELREELEHQKSLFKEG
jgi:pyruvate dehydrogenase E1 component alpha subunit